MKTFIKPLVKYGGKKLDSIFQPGGYKQVGDEYRKMGGPPFPITQDAPPPTQWFCELQGCTRMRDYDGSYHGNCSGYCCVG